MAPLRKKEFEAFYLRMLPRVRKLLGKLHCPWDMQMDIAHIVFMDMWEKVCAGAKFEKPDRYVLQAAKLRWWCTIRDDRRLSDLVDKLNEKYGGKFEQPFE